VIHHGKAILSLQLEGEEFVAFHPRRDTFVERNFGKILKGTCEVREKKKINFLTFNPFLPSLYPNGYARFSPSSLLPSLVSSQPRSLLELRFTKKLEKTKKISEKKNL
jgi:hypothetical protein